jgi:hypothetical protein
MTICPRRPICQRAPLEGQDEKGPCSDGVLVSAHRAADIRDDGDRIYSIS